MNKINEKRTARMRQHSVKTLNDLAKAGTLSSAAAQFEINRRASEKSS